MRFMLAVVCLACASGSLPADPPLVAGAPPRTPAAERASFRLPPGFEAQLVAAEPDIQKPLNLAFDAKGRLWVTCTIEYPYPAAEGKGRDCVKILDDFGPDGRARKVTTFADNLNIPIGILPYKDGAIVHSMRNIWFLRDTDGDGTCDKREVILSGFGTRDTHGMVNGLLLGFDGWVYACHGYNNDSDVTAKDGSRIRMNSGNTFRFKPDGSRVEMVAKGQVNPFGQTIDPEGNLYTACCHSKPITQLMRGAVYPSFSKPHDGMGFGPDMVPQYDGSTALCGLVYYAADAFPAGYRGGMVLGDVVNNRINSFRVECKGASYTALQQPNLLTTDDPWFRPCDIKLGPDGALYVADFYNRIIGHYEVPLDHPGRDRTSGRIWRIVYRGERPTAPPPDRTDWTKASVEELIRGLNHPNLMVRLTATHQLVERGAPVAAAIEAAKGLTPTQIAQALWVLERLGQQDGNWFYGLGPDPRIDAHRMRILAERPRWTDADRGLAQRCLSHSDRLVVRLAVQALFRDLAPKWRHEILELLRASTTDPFLHHAARLALREQLRGRNDWDDDSNAVRDEADVALGLPEPAAAAFLRRHLEALARDPAGRLPEFLHHIARYGKPDDLADLPPLLDATAKDDRARAKFVAAAYQGAQEAGRTPCATFAAWGTGVARALLSGNNDSARHGVELASQLHKSELVAGLTAVANDRARPDALRVGGYAALLATDATSLPAVASHLTDPTETAAVREGVAKALVEQNNAASRAALAAALTAAPARLASAIAAGLAATEPGAKHLCDTVAAGKASPRLLTERAVQVKLAALKKPAVLARVAALTDGLPPADAVTANLLRERLAAYARSPRDSAAGAKVYAKHCANCHQVAGQGAKVGPQLDGIGVRGLERLLEDVLDPNRNVDQSFRTTVVALKSGRTVSGLLLREEGRTLVLADNEGKEQRYSLDDLDTRDASPASPMPPNWAQVIPEGEFHDLMAYLLSLKVK